MGETNPSGLRFSPTVCLDCEFNPLSLKLVELLEKKFCKPLVISADFQEWNRAIFEKSLKETLILKRNDVYLENTNINYLIYLEPSKKKENRNSSMDEGIAGSIRIATKNSCKAIFIFNYFQQENDYKKIISVKNRWGSTNIKKNFRALGYKTGIGLLIALFLIPFTLLITNHLIFSFGKLFLFRLDPSLTKLFFQASKSTSLITQKYSRHTSKIPLAGYIFLQMGESAKLLEKASTIGIKSLKVADDLIYLMHLFSRQEKIDRDRLSMTYTDLDDLSNQMGFFEAELNSNLPSIRLTSKIVLGNIDIEKIRENINNAKNLAEILPQFLGEVKPVTYLILFQDNSLLRSTGGVINKVSLITFSGGEIIDSQTYDSDDLNEKLLGEVEPPQPLKKYVNDSTWFFKDINWDPDFPTSASKAEWFLDKSIDKSVDGVFAINLDFLRDIFEKKNKFLKSSKLKDGKNIRTQASDQEVIDEFFTEVDRLKHNEGTKYLDLLIQGMENKDVQIFLNDNRSSRILNEISWDGSFNYNDCQNNCYSDLVSINEFGIEGAKSQEIKRKASLTVSLEEKLIKRKMIYFLENPTENIYKGYLRMFAPGDAGFGVINVNQKNIKEEIKPNLQGLRGFKEAGVLFEVLPGDTTVLNFSWESGSDYTFDNEGFYDLTWIKQSGIRPFAISIKLEKNKEIVLEATPRFSLTAEDYLGYNTDLSRDYFSRIFWSKN